MIPNNCIIIGGGASIKPYISLLQPLCATNFTILINYSFKTFEGTFLTFQDENLYKPDYAKRYVDNSVIRHPDIYEDLKKLPLIVGINKNGIEEFKLDNTILLNKLYSENLTGIYALKLAELIMEKGNIFLLGFDWTRQPPATTPTQEYHPNSNLNIHYYNREEINHKGQGFTGWYDRNDANKDLIEFIKKDINIYNVSLDSNITCFPKISYEQMFNLLNTEVINQDLLRIEIKEKLCIL